MWKKHPRQKIENESNIYHHDLRHFSFFSFSLEIGVPSMFQPFFYFYSLSIKTKLISFIWKIIQHLSSQACNKYY